MVYWLVYRYRLVSDWSYTLIFDTIKRQLLIVETFRQM